MESTASTPSDLHGLTAGQLSELQGAVQALDAHLLVCVDDLRNNRWTRPNAKHVADCLVRELARNITHRFQVKPIAGTITLHHRTKLLTRRVRAVMRAFNKNPNYLSERPNINWDDSFVPPQLYAETELASLDGGERQQVQGDGKEWEKEKAGEKMEERVSKDKANTMENDKGKAKETAQDRENPDETENLKRKRMRETSESGLAIDITSDTEDGPSSDESEPLAKRAKCKESSDNADMPSPCQRCIISQTECKPNGWHAACKNCRKARQTCSLSKALPNDHEKVKETVEDNKKHDDIEKPKTQRFREIHTSTYTVTKSSIVDDRSSIGDEDDVDQLDEDPAKPSSVKKNVSTTTNDGFIPYDPKCDRCEKSNRECVRREDQDHGARCTHCVKLKQGCSLTSKGQFKINFIPNNPKCDNCKQSHKECSRRETQDHGTACKQCAKDKKGCNLSKGQSKINYIPNDPKCERCEQSHKECVRKDTQDRGSRCKKCVNDHQMCKYLSKSQSKSQSKPPPPKASSSSSNSNNFELELLRQQLKASQEDFRIAQQQLQLANSRIEAQRELYESQLADCRRRLGVV